MSFPLTELKGIGEKTASYFAASGISDTGALIRDYPRDYDRPPFLLPLSEAKEGEEGAFYARVLSPPSLVRVKGYVILNLSLGDGSGKLEAAFYNMPYLKSALKPGVWRVFRGCPVKKGRSLLLRQPKIYQKEEYDRIAGRLLPIYPLSAHLTQKMLAKAVSQALELEEFPEYETGREMLSRREAFFHIHFPESEEALLAARSRLIYDEFFFFLTEVRKLKDENKKLKSTWPLIETADTVRLLESLPYALTGAQKKVWEECREGMLSGHAMNRLIQGDVGSGKTILAILCLLMVCAEGLQGALMAPTEVLARQHFQEIEELTRRYSLPFKPVLLSGSLSAKQKKLNREALKTGEANLAVGTQALITDRVEFSRLGLVVTDEQHRFGVRQRERLSDKGNAPHVIVMSATPIPRTLGMILYGDLDVSVVDELPKGRLPIKNALIPASDRKTALQFMVKKLREGFQAYCICPLVEPGEDAVSPEFYAPKALMNVRDYAAFLKRVLPEDIRVGELNGRMKPGVKNRVMEDFAGGLIDVLVSTTVVEVGVNVPNAVLMIIENAERYGMAALHQLRGRVGRGKAQSYCILIDGSGKEEANERLKILSESNNGFEIAGKDLSLRGPGDFFGLRQSGALPFVLGDIYRDAKLLMEADEDARRLLEEDPELKEHEDLNRFLEDTVLPGRVVL